MMEEKLNKNVYLETESTTIYTILHTFHIELCMHTLNPFQLFGVTTFELNEHLNCLTHIDALVFFALK